MSPYRLETVMCTNLLWRMKLVLCFLSKFLLQQSAEGLLKLFRIKHCNIVPAWCYTGKKGKRLETSSLGTQFSLSFNGSFAAFIEGLLKRLVYVSPPPVITKLGNKSKYRQSISFTTLHPTANSTRHMLNLPSLIFASFCNVFSLLLGLATGTTEEQVML